jgi:single-stranded DNA-binding protein
MAIYGTAMCFVAKKPEIVRVGAYQAIQVLAASSSGYNQTRRTTWLLGNGFGKVGEALARLRAGEQVTLSGEMYDSTYIDKEGQEKHILKMDIKGVTFITGITLTMDKIPDVPWDVVASEMPQRGDI